MISQFINTKSDSSLVDDDFIDKLIGKHRPAIARSISIVEKGGHDSLSLLDKIHSMTGKAYRIGITGPPGAGKSTLINELTKYFRSQGLSIGIIAVDPTSPFTNGAVLGDRVRMDGVESDADVFIRSMATRGNRGGLSAKTIDVADIMDAAGFDNILIESVGIGQIELDIMDMVDTTIVMLVPESGDLVQAIKAGLMEIADIYVLNKSDRPGSNIVLNAVKSVLVFKNRHNLDWSPKIIKAVSNKNKGTEEIASEIIRHRNYLMDTNEMEQRRKRQRQARIRQIVNQMLSMMIWNTERDGHLTDVTSRVSQGEISSQQAAQEIIQKYIRDIHKNQKRE